MASSKYQLMLDYDVYDVPRGLVRQHPIQIHYLLSMKNEDGLLGFQQIAYLIKKMPGPYPKYDKMPWDERLDSLSELASLLSLAKRKEIARAGFFYSGKGLTLTCYHCGCNAMDWQTADDPWLRHAELQPKCPVIKNGIDLHQGLETLSYTSMRRTMSCPEAAICRNPGFALTS